MLSSDGAQHSYAHAKCEQTKSHNRWCENRSHAAQDANGDNRAGCDLMLVPFRVHELIHQRPQTNNRYSD